VIAALLLLSSLGPGPATRADDGPATAGAHATSQWQDWIGRSNSERAEILDAMGRTHQVAFHRTPWREALKEVERLSGIPIYIDDVAVRSFQFADRYVINQVHEKIRLDNLLARLLATPGWCWTIDEGTLRVRQGDQYEHFLTLTYDLRPLAQMGFRIRAPQEVLQKETDRRDRAKKLTTEGFLRAMIAKDPVVMTGPFSSSPTLEELLPPLTNGEWEHIDGYGASRYTIKDQLVVIGPWHVHSELHTVMQALHEIADGTRQRQSVALLLDEDQQAYQWLDRRFDVNIDAVPLEVAVRILAQQTGAPVAVHRRAFGATGDPLFLKVSCRQQQRSLRSALTQLVGPLGYGYGVHQGKIYVAPDANEDDFFVTMLYDVGDFQPHDRDALLKAVTSTQEKDVMWEQLDGMGGWHSILIDRILVVRQIDKAHTTIQRLLNDLRGEPADDHENPRATSKQP